ncbi:MAG: Crp/Fnr family transcriptional regulator [Armatimonadetes bacterium]|nr:Crp/Fnr family transcriptional regulator [Armatimonadota bacterium]
MSEQTEAPSRREVFLSSTLLGGLTDEQVGELVVNSRMAHAEKGETIWLSGSSVSFFGVVGTGFIKMTTVGPSHQEITTEIMGPGHVFGLLGTIDGTGCPQSAKAITGTWYLKVPKAGFLPVYEKNVVLKEQVFKRTAHRLRQSFDLIAHLSVGTVEQRVAAVLLVLTRSFGRELPEGLLLDVPLTRQEIAELAGTTVESTIRIMSRWQKQEWIETQARHILVKDLEKLLQAVR